MISEFFKTFFYKPLLNALVFIVGIIPFHDVGLAVIILTILVNFVILPLRHKTTKTQMKMREIEPEIKQIKEKYKDAQTQTQKVMELYKQHGVSPFSGILGLFIQLPIIFALYRVFLGGFTDSSSFYSFISLPESINNVFLGIVDMTQKSYVLAFFAAFSQYLQMRLSVPPIKNKEIKKGNFKDELAKSMNVQMRYVMPVFFFFIASRFPSVVSLYWTTMNVFAIVHEYLVRKKARKISE